MEPAVEPRQSLLAQQKQLREGYRRVQMFPKGHPELPLPKGYKRTKTKNGDVFHHHPSVSSREIQVASNHGNENHLLDLGPINKHEAVRRVMAGEHPAAVVERDPHGAKVRGAAGTHVTAPYQLAAMERTKSPGHTVGYEDPRPEVARHKLATGGFVPMAEGGDPGDFMDQVQPAQPTGDGWLSQVQPAQKPPEAATGDNFIAQQQGPAVAPDNASAEPAPKAATSLQHTETGEPFYGPMPGMIDALTAGTKHGIANVGKSYTAMSSSDPYAVEPPPTEQNPAAAPFEWRDLYEPSRGAAKTMYRLGDSSPALGMGIAGGVAGAGVGTLAGGPPGSVVGGLMGGVAGSAAGAALQTIGPVFAQELQKDPNDPDGAWSRATQQAMISGAFSGASWAAFPLKFFQGPVKNLAFQVLGVQPTINVGQQVTQNAAAGNPLDENVGQSIAEGVAGSVVPMAGHFALARPTKTTAPDPNITERGPVSAAFVKNIMPEMMSERALQADPVAAKLKAGRQQEADALAAQTHRDKVNWDAVPEQDQRQFINDIQTGQPPDPALQAAHSNIDMQGTANVLRDRLETAYHEEAAYGSPTAYMSDYLPQQYKDPAGVKQYLDAQYANRGPDWFQKNRAFDTYEDAINAGFEPLTTNPIALVNHRLLAGIDMRKRVEFLQDLQQRDMAMPYDPKNPPPNSNEWHHVKAPNQQEWIIAPDAKPLWDRAIEDRSLWADPTIAGDIFRGYSAVKNGFISAKLGLSGFHILHVMHIQSNDALARGLGMAFGRGQQTIGQRLMALPKALKEATTDQLDAMPVYTPHEGKDIRKAWQTMPKDQTPEQKQDVKNMVEGGFRPQMSEQLKLQTKTAFMDAIKQGQYAKAIPPAIAAPFRALQKPIFEEWIPNLKAASYKNAVADFAARHPDLYQDDIQRGIALRAIAKQTDNRFGEMNYDTLFWQRTMRDIVVGLSTSAGWNLGFLREHVGAVADRFTNRLMTQTPERQTMRAARNRGAYTVSYMASAMLINGFMSSYLSGQSPEGYDYIFPRIGGQNPDGSPRRVNNMFYTREAPMIANHVEQSGLLGGLLQTAQDKTALIGPASHLITNRDYFGQQVVDENAPGWKQALQYGKGILNEMDPITFTSAQRALQLAGKPNSLADVLRGVKDGDPDVLRSMAGFGPAPVYSGRTHTETMISHLYGAHVAPKERPYDEGKKTEQQGLRDAYLVAKQSGDAARIRDTGQALAKSGMKPSTIAQMQPGTMLPYLFSKLPAKDQIDVLYGAPKEEFKKFYARSSKEVRADPRIVDRWKHYYGRQ